MGRGLNQHQSPRMKIYQTTQGQNLNLFDAVGKHRCAKNNLQKIITIDKGVERLQKCLLIYRYKLIGGDNMKNKSHMKWAWTIMIGFLTLGIVDFRFGILGFVCMGAPMYHALRGRVKCTVRNSVQEGRF